MISLDSLKYHNSIIDLFKCIKYKRNFNKEHPNYFYPCGLTAFVGPQGSGKTLSAVNYVRNLIKIYPNVMVVSNLDLTFLNEDDELSFHFIDADDFFRYKNGEEGVIFLIDEIQLYFNSLQSKNINIDVINFISQQRKQRAHIVATSQVFGRMAKPLREQFDSVILCKNYFGLIAKLMIIDRDSIDSNESTGTNINAKVKKTIWNIMSPEMWNWYDTYKVIEGTSFAYGEQRKEDYYGLRYSNHS